jgi:protein gp37
VSAASAIHWTDATWNPVTGCSRVSPGCEHCYAEALSLRYGWSRLPWTAPHAAENVVLHPERLGLPLRWRQPRRVFVNSMSDLFHERVPEAFIEEVFRVMAAAGWHTFQVLTKRPARMHAVVASDTFASAVGGAHGWPLPNVWLGTSVEDQRRADERVPLLARTPAAVRFLSCEPLLGPLDLAPWLDRLGWVIVGGESGPRHRPMDPDWARALRDQCAAAGVPFFFKQGAGPRPGMHRELDGRLWEQFPEEPVA